MFFGFKAPSNADPADPGLSNGDIWRAQKQSNRTLRVRRNQRDRHQTHVSSAPSEPHFASRDVLPRPWLLGVHGLLGPRGARIERTGWTSHVDVSVGQRPLFGW